MSIVEALRCSSKPASNEQDCQNCKWHLIDYCDEHPDIGIPADGEINGRKVWIGCDTDRIALEAANLLEKLISKDLIDRDALIRSVKCSMDMQDLYLPVHFLDVVADAEGVTNDDEYGNRYGREHGV